MKKLLSLKDVKVLEKFEQQSIFGGNSEFCDPCAGKSFGERCLTGCIPGNVGECTQWGCMTH
ncbi:hypothetical protein [Spongiimicrobium sp. 3-5]|uniref:hypothetical protein n=1 Tax=Spongiimicrobium sp. 3-5 TaxID=3332596 RepID=UPI00397FA624